MPRFSRSALFLACAYLTAAALSTFARADQISAATLSDATANVNPTNPGIPTGPTGTFDLSLYPADAVLGSYLAAAEGGSDPSIYATNRATYQSNQSYQYPVTSSAVVYQFEVGGPASQSVPILVSATGSATISGYAASNAGVIALFSIASGGSTLLSDSACVGVITCPGSYGTFITDGDIDVQTDTVYTVDLTAETLFEGILDVTGFPPTSLSAFVDPTIVLDTSNPAYSLSFSPGVGPTPAPEPNYLALTLPCIGLGFFLVHRRRKQEALAVYL